MGDGDESCRNGRSSSGVDFTLASSSISFFATLPSSLIPRLPIPRSPFSVPHFGAGDGPMTPLLRDPGQQDADGVRWGWRRVVGWGWVAEGMCSRPSSFVRCSFIPRSSLLVPVARWRSAILRLPFTSSLIRSLPFPSLPCPLSLRSPSLSPSPCADCLEVAVSTIPHSCASSLAL